MIQVMFNTFATLVLSLNLLFILSEYIFTSLSSFIQFSIVFLSLLINLILNMAPNILQPICHVALLMEPTFFQ